MFVEPEYKLPLSQTTTSRVKNMSRYVKSVVKLRADLQIADNVAIRLFKICHYH